MHFRLIFIRNGVGNPTIDQYDTSSQFLKSTNYTKPKQTNMQVLDEDYAQTYQKLKDNLAAVLESEKASYPGTIGGGARIQRSKTANG